MTDFIWLHSEDALREKVIEWCELSFVTMDTEFVRENTYHAKPGLIQVADRENVYLIDPLEVQDLSLLGPLLSSKTTLKVMHAMSEDVELLSHVSDVELSYLFDTQIAAGFLGYGPSLGYQNLVATVLGHELDKTETRSDWLKRPLSDSQLSYAAKDVEYLIALYDELQSQLQKRNLFDAVVDESEAVVLQWRSSQTNADLEYLKLRGAWDLKLKQQYILQGLVLWRDNLAQAQNIPKPWVFGDHQLIQVSKRPPKSLRDLHRLDGVKHKSIRLFGDELMSVLNLNADKAPPENFVMIDRPIKGKELDIYKRLKKVVQAVENESNISAQLLGSRKMLERFVIHSVRKKNVGLPLEFSGWRKALVGDRLLEALSG